MEKAKNPYFLFLNEEEMQLNPLIFHPLKKYLCNKIPLFFLSQKRNVPNLLFSSLREDGMQQNPPIMPPLKEMICNKTCLFFTPQRRDATKCPYFYP